jgi:hypothetical protein
MALDVWQYAEDTRTEVNGRLCDANACIANATNGRMLPDRQASYKRKALSYLQRAIEDIEKVKREVEKL